MPQVEDGRCGEAISLVRVMECKGVLEKWSNGTLEKWNSLKEIYHYSPTPVFHYSALIYVR